MEGLPWDVVYNPVTLNGELLQDGNKRKLINQNIRVNSIANNIEKDSSYLDLGCNTGFILKELVRLKNIKGVGIDHVESAIQICNAINSIEKLDIEFIQTDMHKFIFECIETNTLFDNVALMSVDDWDNTIKKMDKLLSLTRNKLFIEPTNHEFRSVDETQKIVDENLTKKYRIKVLTITDYQDRFLCMVEK
jgi:2-polyprenyl-3-methyl-5-hydroxy-6-metoxy-1,4-benzoquinol methylase